MKSYKHLFEKVCNFENLYESYLSARKGKRFKPDVDYNHGQVKPR